MANENQVLARLPPSVRERLHTRLETVPLHKGQTLIDVGEPVRHAYFPTKGLVSLVALTAEGGTVELSTVAAEGFVGLPIVLHADTTPHLAIVRLAGAALRIRAESLRAELRQHEALRVALLAYANRSSAEVSQAVVCQCFHNVLQRLCRWLLTAADRLGTHTLELTQDSLAQVLGVARPVVTKAALELQDAAAIHCRHGRIEILNRPILERSACECYQLMRDADSSASIPAV